jgi:hypothetical protein
MPITLRQAQAFVQANHRHHKPPRGSKFAVGAALNGELVGVVVVGRPNARTLDDGQTCEVTRTCTLGDRNVNSFLYGIAHRIAREMGYRKQITYTEEGESGVSLRASGFKMVATLEPRANWAGSSIKLKHLRDSAIRADITRFRWEKLL